MRLEDFARQIRSEARRWEKAPFRFRGYTPMGADCIGLIVGLLRKCGLQIPDDDGGVYEADWFLHDKNRNRYLDGFLKFGRIVAGIDRDRRRVEGEPIQAGDVACFWFAYDKVVHAGLYLGADELVHSHRTSQGVQIVSMKVPWAHRSPKTWIRLRPVEELLGG